MITVLAIGLTTQVDMLIIIIIIMVFICIAARILDYTISAKQDSAYNITRTII